MTWTVSPAGTGSIGSNGTYTAPAAVPVQPTVTVKATSVADPTKSYAATVTLLPLTIQMSPSSASLYAGQTRQFSASIQQASSTAVSWTLNPPGVGSVSATGLYTAPVAIPLQTTVAVIATSVADPTKSTSATIVLTPLSIQISPSSANVNAGASQQFSAQIQNASNTTATWSLTPQVGSISTNGLYTAPAVIGAQRSVTVTAASASDPTKTASSVVTLVTPITVNPPSVTLSQTQTQQFTASVTGLGNTAVRWSTSLPVGAISSTGLYTAPASITAAQTFLVIAASVQDSTKQASATVTLAPPVSVSLSPTSVTLSDGQPQPFTTLVLNASNTSVNWTVYPAGMGTVSAAGVYSAPNPITAAANVSVIATSVADPTKSATATVSLVPAISVKVAPLTATMIASQTQAFVATVLNTPNTAVNWTVTPPGTGQISPAGIYTAPASIAAPTVVTITATSAADSTKVATAAVSLQPSVVTPVTSLVPSVLAMVVGDSRTLQALNSLGQTTTPPSWNSSDPTIVSLSTDNPPVLSALAPGHVTITAGSASASITVSATALPTGSVIWSNPGDGSGVQQIIPAVPSPTGVADIFAIYNSGLLQAVTSDGTVAWAANVGDLGYVVSFAADFQGGLSYDKYDPNTQLESISRLDGMTGQIAWVYTMPPSGGTEGTSTMTVHPDGTIFTRQYVYDPDHGRTYYAVGTSAAGAERFRIPLQGPTGTNDIAGASNFIVAGDGYGYMTYLIWDTLQPYDLRVLKVDTQGGHQSIDVQQFAHSIPNAVPGIETHLITNADQGILLSYTFDPAAFVTNDLPLPVPANAVPARQRRLAGEGAHLAMSPRFESTHSIFSGLATISGSSETVVTTPMPTSAGQVTALLPVVQQSDGSYIGAYGTGDQFNPQYTMVAFDTTGATRWTVANEYPKIATADGGVIGKSGTVYDQGGSPSSFTSTNLTYSWLAQAYTTGSLLQRVLAQPDYVATSFWAFAGGNASGNNSSVNADWFPALDHCTTSPGCIGHHEAIYNALNDLISRLRDPAVAAAAQTAIFDKLHSDVNGNPLTTRSFIRYLTSKTPGFYDGTRSTYCYQLLTPPSMPSMQPLCPRWVSSLGFNLVRDEFASRPTAGAVAGTSSYPLLTFFRPSFILYNSSGRNVGNESTIFHEALHGMTGKSDQSIDYAIWHTIVDPSCRISLYIKENVLANSAGLDPASDRCPGYDAP